MKMRKMWKNETFNRRIFLSFIIFAQNEKQQKQKRLIFKMYKGNDEEEREYDTTNKEPQRQLSKEINVILERHFSMCEKANQFNSSSILQKF